MTHADPLLDAFQFACPITGARLERLSEDSLHSPHNGNVYRCVDGIWRFMRLHRAAFFAQFIEEYEAIRRAEGRSGRDAGFFRSLPYYRGEATSRFHSAAAWRQRAQTFETLLARVIRPLAKRRQRPLLIADVGAGNGWLSNRLAAEGHHVLAVDLGASIDDGLGAFVNYETRFIPVQAEFDALPLTDHQLDAVVFNAALHYTLNYEVTLREAVRTLRRDGRLVIADTPVYQDAESGLAMVRERDEEFLSAYGLSSDSIASENFLTYGRLNTLALALGVVWQMHWPTALWRWQWRRLRARRSGQREPAQFPLVVGTLI